MQPKYKSGGVDGTSPPLEPPITSVHPKASRKLQHDKQVGLPTQHDFDSVETCGTLPFKMICAELKVVK